MYPIRFRLRSFVIGIALLAPLLAAAIFLFKLSTRLNAFYGAGGVISRKNRAGSEALAGEEELRLGHYAEAVDRYRSALDLEESLPQPVGVRDTSRVLLGLADALASQGRDGEAELLYRRALEIREKVREQPPVGDPQLWDPWVEEALDRYASLLRKGGRFIEADKLVGRRRKRGHSGRPGVGRPGRPGGQT